MKEPLEMTIISNTETQAEETLPILQPDGEAKKEDLKQLVKKVTIGIYLVILLILLYELLKD